MRGALTLAFVVSTAGCFTDINGTGSDDDDGDVSSSSADEGEVSSTTDAADTREPDSDSDPGGGSTSGPSATSEASSDEGTTTGSDTDTADATGSLPPPTGWPARCVFNPGPPPPCDEDPLSISKAGADQCELSGFANDGEGFCSLPEFAETNLQSPPGQHVIGLLGVPGAISVVGQNAEAAPLNCAPAWGSFATIPADATGLAVRVRASGVPVAPIVVRPAAGLCELPAEGANCCTGAGASPASTACGDAGLRECVVGFDPYCDETAWDDLCVATAVLRCGANCLALAD